MITFSKACEIAKQEFLSHGYARMTTPAFILGDCWLFEARFFDENITEYGICPIKISQNDEKIEWYSISDPSHWDALDNISETVEVPSQYLKF